MTTFTDQLKLEIIVDPSGAVSVLKGFGQQATGELETAQNAAGAGGVAAGQAYGTNFANTALLGLQALASAAATLGITSFARTAITDADEFLRANVQLDAELKAVGGSAGVTEQSINSLASSLQKSQDVYAGTVKQGAALLLTFTSIQNQPGAGNDIFNRTLTDATAISNVFKRDIPTSITQLGRALEDPLTGIVSLQRGGLAISEQDKQRVRDLAKQGDLLGAQNALLSAIESKGIVQAGAAAGQGDPIQRFTTDLETFKVAVGKDFLPLLAVIDTGLEDVGAAFGAIPEPIRSVITIMAAAAIGGSALVGVVVSLRTALGALKAIQLAATGGSEIEGAAGAAGVAALGTEAGAAAEEVAVLDTQITATNEQLDLFAARFTVAADGLATDNAILATTTDQLALFDAELVGVTGAEAAATEESGIFSAALASLGATASEVGASFASIGVLGTLGAAAAGFAAFTVTYTALKAIVGANDTPFSKLSKDGAQLTTDLGTADKQARQIGSNNPFAETAGYLGTLSHSSQQAAHDIKEVNTNLEQIATQQGPAEAYQAFLKMEDAVTAAGGSAQTFTQYMGPALDAIHQAFIEANQAAQGLQGFDAQFAQLAQGAITVASDNTALAQSFEAIQTAKQKVADDKADIAGTGPGATSAIQAESAAYDQLKSAVEGVANAKQTLADAYHSLNDAQLTVTSSARTLLEAQQALDEFNSARGAEERSLATDIINRRVATTPEQEDQKRLDLLNQQDSTQQKQQSLQDAVTNAQKSYADAIYAVGKAQRDIVKDQQAVADATDKVSTSEKNLQDAIQKRAAIAKTAHDALIKDELDVQAAVEQTASKLVTMAQNGELVNDTWLKGLKSVADELLPGGAFKTALDNALSESIATYEIGQATIGTTNGNSATGGLRGNHAAASTPSTAAPTGGLDPVIVQLLHALGVPGYDTGGLVPGALGSPQLAVVHGGERVQTPAQQREGTSAPVIHQTNHFYGQANAELDWANAQLAWGIARWGRG